MKSFKIKLLNPTLDKVIQEKLLELGYQWATSGKKYTEAPYKDYEEKAAIFCDKYGSMVYSDIECIDRAHIAPWITIEELFSFGFEKTLKLNDNFEVKVDLDEKVIKTSYGDFSFAVLEQFKKLINPEFASYPVYIYEHTVKVGCQTFERAELEKLFRICGI